MIVFQSLRVDVCWVHFTCDKCQRQQHVPVYDARPDLVEGQVFIELAESIGVDEFKQDGVPFTYCEVCAEGDVGWTETLLFKKVWDLEVNDDVLQFVQTVAPVLDQVDTDLPDDLCACWPQWRYLCRSAQA